MQLPAGRAPPCIACSTVSILSQRLAWWGLLWFHLLLTSPWRYSSSRESQLWQPGPIAELAIPVSGRPYLDLLIYFLNFLGRPCLVRALTPAQASSGPRGGCGAAGLGQGASLHVLQVRVGFGMLHSGQAWALTRLHWQAALTESVQTHIGPTWTPGRLQSGRACPSSRWWGTTTSRRLPTSATTPLPPTATCSTSGASPPPSAPLAVYLVCWAKVVGGTFLWTSCRPEHSPKP